MQYLKKLLFFNTIRKKMLLYYMVTVCLMSSISLYTLYISNDFMRQIDAMFIRSIYLEELSGLLTTVNEDMFGYLTTKDSDSLNNYHRNSEELKEKADFIGTNYTYDESGLMLKDISNMTREYLTRAKIAIDAKRGRNIDLYTSAYHEAGTIEKYIKSYIDRLNLMQTGINTGKYTVLYERLTVLQYLNIILIADIVVLSILIIIKITYSISDPIIKLSRSAEELSKGNFETEVVITSKEDELKTMLAAFNKMKENIRLYIEELKSKAVMESTLKDQQMENLKMQNLLYNAKLQALQAQINPHFLFNTLNAGVQLAMMEEAELTGEFLENMTALFRYNIKDMDKEVTLAEEVSNVKAYAEILRVRFGDVIGFEYDLDETLFELTMPPLVLQPLVENACIHGLGGLEQGGRIRVTARRSADRAEIMVYDNGVGMDGSKIREIFDEFDKELLPGRESRPKKGHTTGIGLSNVIQRLNLYFGKRNSIAVDSAPGCGTTIVISVPLSFWEEERNVQNLYCG